jgi:hypothetical protein
VTIDPDADPRPDIGGAYDYRFAALTDLDYAPEDDGDPDPGEVVWCWVPYEEDHRQGKDRPVVAVGHALAPGSEGDLVVLMLSSRDHHDEPEWFAIGTGEWDRERRDSWVRLDRPLAVAPGSVRREGGTVVRERFAALVQAAAAAYEPVSATRRSQRSREVRGDAPS